MSIIQEWVGKLGLRHQGVLVTSIRGCDGAIKEDSTKPIAREMRGLILRPFDERELTFERGFMTRFPSPQAETNFANVIRSMDHYPIHYMFHLIHAIEIIGYNHPIDAVRSVYTDRYVKLVRSLHMAPESKEQCDARLNEDRIGNGTVE